MGTRAVIDEFLRAKRLAIAGASRDKSRVGSMILKELRRMGYEMLPVHPVADELQGLPCVHRLADLEGSVDGLILVVPPAQTEILVREAEAAGIGRVWMQQGAESADAVEYCGQNGLVTVHGQCILMFAEPTGPVHRVHRWMWRVLGKLPD